MYKIALLLKPNQFFIASSVNIRLGKYNGEKAETKKKELSELRKIKEFQMWLSLSSTLILLS